MPAQKPPNSTKTSHYISQDALSQTDSLSTSTPIRFTIQYVLSELRKSSPPTAKIKDTVYTCWSLRVCITVTAVVQQGRDGRQPKPNSKKMTSARWLAKKRSSTWPKCNNFDILVWPLPTKSRTRRSTKCSWVGSAPVPAISTSWCLYPSWSRPWKGQQQPSSKTKWVDSSWIVLFPSIE